MQNLNLICNFKKCRKTITQTAWVTSCSHVLCYEHGNEIMENNESKKCSICNTSFNDRYDCLRIDVDPTEGFKSMVLAGLRPELIIEVARRAFSFWSYQILQERYYLESLNKIAMESAQLMNDYCENINAKFKTEQQKMQRKVEGLEKDVQSYQLRIEQLVQEVADKTRLLNNVQNRYEAIKHTNLATNMVNGDVNVCPPMINKFNDIGKQFDQIPKYQEQMRYSNLDDIPRRFPPMHPFEQRHNFVEPQREQNTVFTFKLGSPFNCNYDRSKYTPDAQ